MRHSSSLDAILQSSNVPRPNVFSRIKLNHLSSIFEYFGLSKQPTLKRQLPITSYSRLVLGVLGLVCVCGGWACSGVCLVLACVGWACVWAECAWAGRAWGGCVWAWCALGCATRTQSTWYVFDFRSWHSTVLPCLTHEVPRSKWHYL